MQVGYKPGVKDTVGEASSEGISMLLRSDANVYTSRLFYLSGELSESDVKRISSDMLYNESIQSVRITRAGDFGEKSYLPPPKVSIPHEPKVEYVDLNLSGRALQKKVKEINDKRAASDKETLKIANNDDWLVYISEDRHLALNLDEMRTLKDYFSSPGVKNERAFRKAFGDGTLQKAYRKVMGLHSPYRRIGQVTDGNYMKITGLDGSVIMNEDTGGLKGAWKGTYARR